MKHRLRSPNLRRNFEPLCYERAMSEIDFILDFPHSFVKRYSLFVGGEYLYATPAGSYLFRPEPVHHSVIEMAFQREDIVQHSIYMPREVADLDVLAVSQWRLHIHDQTFYLIRRGGSLPAKRQIRVRRLPSK